MGFGRDDAARRFGGVMMRRWNRGMGLVAALAMAGALFAGPSASPTSRMRSPR